MAQNAPLSCVVVTPEKAVLDERADFIVVPMVDGELGIGHNRLPLIGRLGFGELRITLGQRTQHYYIDGGFLQIRNNVVTLLTAKAIPTGEIKTHAAQEVLATPKVETTREAQDARLKALERARTQLRLARKTPEEAR